MHKRGVTILLLGLLASPSLWAQGEVRGTEVGQGQGEETVGESKVAKIHAVERGLWFSADYGPYYQLAMSLPQQDCFPCLGSQIGVRVGYDILNNLEVDAFVRGSFAKFKTEYAQVYSGDLASYYTGLSLRFSYLTIPAPLNRFHATVRVGGGGALLLPAESAGNQPVAPVVDAALGVEYFTRLRHFSVGLEFETLAFLYPMSVGFSLYPTFKYTF